jgi:hypothetical protein
VSAPNNIVISNVTGINAGIESIGFPPTLMGHEKAVLINEMQTDDKFVLVLKSDNPGNDIKKFDAQLKEYGALEVRVQN